jgi:hypothetical protein
MGDTPENWRCSKVEFSLTLSGGEDSVLSPGIVGNAPFVFKVVE